MEQIVFAKQIHAVWIESRAYGDLEYKQRTNWNSPKPLQRERANALFDRVEQAIYNIANDIDTGDVVPTGIGSEYVCKIQDNIGRIIFEMVIDDNEEINIIIKEFIWDYKTIRGSWWLIVEQSKISKIITEQIELFLRKECI